MNNLKLIFFIVISFLCVQGYSQEYKLRGKIVSIQPQTHDTIAVNEAIITLFSKSDNNKWVSHATTMSNSEGFYFFEKMKAGIYYLQVNKKKNYKITIEEPANGELQDLALIVY